MDDDNSIAFCTGGTINVSNESSFNTVRYYKTTTIRWPRFLFSFNYRITCWLIFYYYMRCGYNNDDSDNYDDNQDDDNDNNDDIIRNRINIFSKSLNIWLLAYHTVFLKLIIILPIILFMHPI